MKTKKTVYFIVSLNKRNLFLFHFQYINNMNQELKNNNP